MDLLFDWLGKAVEQALQGALAWKIPGGNQPPLTLIDGDRIIHDDGSQLKAQASKGGVLQIIKWLEFGTDPKAILSDGISSINVSFKPTAIQSYEKEHKKRLTDGTLGGLLQLVDFEVVATHVGPRPDRITLCINSFKALGSNGSRQVGVAPHSVTSREVVKAHLRKLTMLREEENTGSHKLSRIERPSEAPSFGSQPAHSSSGEDAQPASQVFATQAPVSKRPVPRASELDVLGVVSSASNGGNSAVSDILLKPIASNTKIGKPSKPSTITKHPLAVQAKRRPPISNGKGLPGVQALLDLLPQQRKVPTPVAVSRDLPEVRMKASVSETDCVLESMRDDTSTRDPSPGVVSAHRQLARSEMRISISPTAKDTAELSVDVVSTIPAKRKSPSSYQADVRSRISSRDVRITKDQEALLNSQDSWIPAEPGHREPVANVPISILQAMNQDADLDVSHSTTPWNSDKGVINARQPIIPRRQSLQSAATDTQSESASDVPLSSEQWPQSPIRDHLPPDSSGNTVRSNHSPQHGPTHTTSGIETRRTSRASASSDAASSRQPSSKLSIEPWQQSKEPYVGPVSPSPISPSIMSSSAGEENQSFRCRAAGCTKSYNDAGSLKYHVGRRHNDRGAVQTFKCKVGNCNKSYPSPAGLKYHTEQRHHDSQPRTSHIQSETLTSRASTPVLPMPCSANPHMSETKGAENGDSEQHSSDSDFRLSTTSARANLPPKRKSDALPQEDWEFTAHHSPGRFNSQFKSVAGEASLQAQPTLLNGAPEPGREPASTHSRSASPESDLETTVPLPLHENKDLHVKSAPQQRFPSTASQPDPPFTQVKRTPYLYGHIQDVQTQGSGPQTSPSKWQGSQPFHSTLPEDITHVSASIPSTLAKSSADLAIAHMANNVTLGHVGEDDPDPRVADRNAAPQFMQVDLHPQGPAENNQEPVEDYRIEATGADIPDQDPVICAQDTTFRAVEEGIDESPLQQSGIKCSFSDADFLSPNVPKRRKRFKVASNFNLTEDMDDGRDPLEEARRYRQDFMESRRNSERSSPMQSPTAPFAAQRQGMQPSSKTRPATFSEQDPIQLKTTEGHIDQNVIDLEETEDLSAGDDKYEPLNVIEGVETLAITTKDSGKILASPSLDFGAKDSMTDGFKDGGSNGVAGADFHMPEAELQSTVASIDTDTLRSAILDPSSNVDMNVREPTPAARIHEPSHLMVEAPGTESQANATKNPAQRAQQNNTSKEPSHHHQCELHGTGDLELQALEHQESPPLSPCPPISQYYVRDRNSDQYTASAPPPFLEGTEDTKPDDQEMQSHRSPSEAALAQDSLSDEAPGHQQHDSTTVAGSTFSERTQSSAFVTEPASLDVPVPVTSMVTQPPNSVPMEGTQGIVPSAPASIYERFRAAYPAYSGDMKHFVAICRKISILLKSNRMEHQSLWDDFIVRHKVEYAHHLRQCAEDAEDSLPYEEFYHNNIEDPQHHRRIINRKNLDEALSLIEQAPSVRNYQGAAVRSADSRTHESKLPENSEISIATPSKVSEARVTIDLTKDDPGSNPRRLAHSGTNQSTTSNNKKAGRSIPFDEPENSRSRQASREIDVATSSNAVHLGQGSESLHSLDASGNRNIDTSAPREVDLLMRKHSESSNPGSDSTAKPYSASSLPSETISVHARYEASIRERWGINPHDFLDRKYIDELGTPQMGRLWSVAQDLGLAEARHLIRRQIQARVKSNSNSQTRKMTKVDLNAVRQIIQNRKKNQGQAFGKGGVRGMNAPDLLSLPKTNTAEEAQDKKVVDQWWQDKDSPFTAFVRAYRSIQPGKGNSYAKNAKKATVRTERVEKVQKQIIDILGWSL